MKYRDFASPERRKQQTLHNFTSPEVGPSVVWCAMKPKSILVLFLALGALCQAADFKSAKVLELKDASEVGANTVSDSSEGLAGAPGFVPAVLSRCRLTVAIEKTSYTAIFPVNKHLKIGDFNAGDFISARIEGNKLVIKTLDGKEMKSKIASHEPVEAVPQEKPASSPAK